MENLRFTVRIFKERPIFVAHVPELAISSCGDAESQARHNIRDAVAGFAETVKELVTLKEKLEESRYRFENGRWREPEVVGAEQMHPGLD